MLIRSPCSPDSCGCHSGSQGHGFFTEARGSKQPSVRRTRWVFTALSCFLDGLPGGSAGKECACTAGDLDSIPGLGRPPGEGIGYPLQYSWASPAAQLVKNLPARQDMPVRFLGWEDPLEKGTATHSSILAWRIPRIV